MDSVFTEDTNSGLSDCLRANVSRFAAYKAQYVETALKRALNDETIAEKDRPKFAKAVLRTFNRYQDAERSTATARARTAKQFEEFLQPNNLRLFPNLKWLPSRSAEPRQSHTAFYNRVWAKDDPFWTTNAPGTEWNCKCDIEETDEPITDNIALPQPTVPLGLEGNPAQTGEIFTDQASYIRMSGRNRHTREEAESRCRSLMRDYLQHNASNSPLKDKECTASINGTDCKVGVETWGISETAQSMYHANDYWLKNEILNNFDKYLPNGVYNGSAPVDLTHNTGRTLRRKRHFRQFHYVSVEVKPGLNFCVHIAEHNSGNYYIYTITKNSPV